MKVEKKNYSMRRENFPVLNNEKKIHEKLDSEEDEDPQQIMKNRLKSDHKVCSNAKLSLSIKNGMANISDHELSPSLRYCSSQHDHIQYLDNYNEEIPKQLSTTKWCTETASEGLPETTELQPARLPETPANYTDINYKEDSRELSACSTNSDKDSGAGNDDVEQLKEDIRRETKAKESLLDDFCDQVVSSQEQTPKKQLRNVEINLKNYNRNKAIAQSKKNQIDPKKKVKLLAALKAIDSNDSFDS